MSVDGSAPPGSAAALFRLLWQELVDLIGTPATAALMRRAIKRAAARGAEAELPAVHREGLEYVHVTPAPWHDTSDGRGLRELSQLVRDELDPLFRELTGVVIARRLAQVPELVEAGLAHEE